MPHSPLEDGHGIAPVVLPRLPGLGLGARVVVPARLHELGLATRRRHRRRTRFGEQRSQEVGQHIFCHEPGKLLFVIYPLLLLGPEVILEQLFG